MEGNHHGAVTSIIITKPVEKYIRVDSIYVDLFGSSSDDKRDGQNCENFSIRGYVSDMRKKDGEICWPFPDLEDDRKSNKSTPSLLPTVRDLHFKGGNDQNFQHERPDKGAVVKSVIFNCLPNIGNFPISTVEKTSKQDHVVDGRTINGNASSSNVSFEPSCSGDEKGKRLEVADGINDTLISGSGLGCVREKVIKTQPCNRNLKVTKGNSTANFQTEKKAPASVNHQDRPRPFNLLVSENESMGDVDIAHPTLESQTNGDPSMEKFNQRPRINASDESADVTVELIDLDDYHLEKFHRRKSRKIRLLTELLGENGFIRSQHAKGSSDDISYASAKPDHRRSASNCPTTMQENSGHLVHNRKRRLSRREKCSTHQEIPYPYDMDKKIQTRRRDIETSVSSSGTESEDAFLETKKVLCSNCKLDGNHTAFAKKKIKRFQAVDPCSLSSVPSRDDNYYYEIHKVKETLEIRPNEFSGRIPHSKSLNVKSRTFKNPSPNPIKKPMIDEGLTTLFPWNSEVLTKGSVIPKEVEITKNGTVINPFHYTNYKINEKHLHLSTNNYSNPHRYHKKIISQREDELPTLVSKQDGAFKVNNVKRKDIRMNYLRDSNHLYSASDVLYGQGENGKLNGKMANYRVPLPNQKHNLDFHVGNNSWSQLQQKDIYNGTDDKKVHEPLEPLAPTRRGNRVDLASKANHETLDDIPMEIVELMARNQYERHLHDAENDKHLFERSNCSRNVQLNDYGHMYRNGSRLLKKPENHKQKPQARSGGNAKISTGKFVEARKQKPAVYYSNIDECHFDMNHPWKTRTLENNNSFRNFKEKQSKIHHCTEHRKLNRTVAESRTCNSRMESFGGHVAHSYNSERNFEAACQWPSSMMPNHLPYGYQKVPTDREKLYSPRSLHLGNVNTQNHQNQNQHPTNLEKSDRKENYFYCHNNGIEPHQNMVGSMELSTNDTIPAMHLLSLMDSGRRSNVPINARGTHKLTTKPPYHVHPLKHFSKMNTGLNKSSRDIHYSYSPSAFYDEVHIPEKFQFCSPAAPSIRASACTFQHKGLETNTDFTNQSVSKVRNRRTTKFNDQSTSIKGQTSPKSVFSRGGSTENGTFPVKSLYSTNSKVFNLAHYMEKSSKGCKLIFHKNTHETEMCSVNKNPADFSLPEAGSVYMIGAEDFNFVSDKNRSSSVYFN